VAELVANCPRCGAREMTFDLHAQHLIVVKYKWQHWFEVFCICRGCSGSTTFVLSQREVSDKDKIIKGLVNLNKAVNQYMNIEGYISLKDIHTKEPPEFIPENIDKVFREGAACMSIGCYNAAGTMFRLCIDLSTRAMLPEVDQMGLNSKVKRNLGLRLPWLFDNKILPEILRELSTCIKEDGNDGAHEGTLSKSDAEDLLDFTYVLLERIYTEPKRLELAKDRRLTRRQEKQ
jgi:hypothetical protein